MEYLFAPRNWQWLFEPGNFRYLLEGFAVNIQVAAVAIVVSLALGLALCLLRIRGPVLLRVPVRLWIDLWRNLPTTFVLLYIAITIPGAWRLGYENAMHWLPGALGNGGFFVGVVGLSLYYSALLAEIFRAGIQSLGPAQHEAAVSLGLTVGQSMRLVELPQAVRAMVPAVVSQLISLTKNTSLLSIIAIEEAIRNAQILATSNFFTGVQAPLLQVFIVVGAMFVAVNIALSRLSARFENDSRKSLPSKKKEAAHQLQS